jgi:hypothetical protein
MASGNTLLTFDPRDASFPASSFPTFDVRNNHPVLDFGLSPAETAYFEGIMPRHYAGGGVTIYLHFAMSSASSGNIKIETDFERIGNEWQTLDSNGFAGSPQSAETGVPSAGLVKIANTTHTNGAQMDSVAIGEKFRLSVKRVSVAGDATGDLELVGIEIKET